MDRMDSAQQRRGVLTIFFFNCNSEGKGQTPEMYLDLREKYGTGS